MPRLETHMPIRPGFETALTGLLNPHIITHEATLTGLLNPHNEGASS